MKNKIVKTFPVVTLLAFFTLTGFGQPIALTSNSDSTAYASIDKTKIPKTVTDAFMKQYPVTTNETWAAFPANGYTNAWYNDSYSSVASANSNTQNYFVVEYTTDKVDQKSIYSNDRAKIATHCVLTKDLPKPVSEAISKGDYKSWDMAAEKEEIFKDKQTDSMKVYKVEVTSENEKHTLFYQTDGKLLKDVKVS